MVWYTEPNRSGERIEEHFLPTERETADAVVEGKRKRGLTAFLTDHTFSPVGRIGSKCGIAVSNPMPPTK